MDEETRWFAGDDPEEAFIVFKNKAQIESSSIGDPSMLAGLVPGVSNQKNVYEVTYDDGTKAVVTAGDEAGAIAAANKATNSVPRSLEIPQLPSLKQSLANVSYGSANKQPVPAPGPGAPNSDARFKSANPADLAWLEIDRLQNSKAAPDRHQAIQKAIQYFGIDTAKVKDMVRYDPDSKGDGYTLADGTVRIGRAAFGKSTGWLGSTLGHEIEVHLALQVLDGKWRLGTGPQATAITEVQAYDYEIRNAARFGTTPTEIAELQNRRASYYNQLTPANQQLVNSGKYTP